LEKSEEVWGKKVGGGVIPKLSLWGFTTEGNRKGKKRLEEEYKRFGGEEGGGVWDLKRIVCVQKARRQKVPGGKLDKVRKQQSVTNIKRGGFYSDTEKKLVPCGEESRN